MKFRFAEEEDACEYVTRLAAELHLYAPAHALKVRLVNGWKAKRNARQRCTSECACTLYIAAHMDLGAVTVGHQRSRAINLEAADRM